MIGRIKFNSPVILMFVIISLAALGLNEVTKGKTNELLFSVYRSSGTDPLSYVRLIGHVFGHVDWEHFSANITILLLVGPLLEEKYGSFNMAMVILVTAFITGVINMLFFDTTLLGASGVVYALILLSSMTCNRDDSIPLTFILVAVIYIGGQVVKGIMVKDYISNSTHVIGGILGCIFGYVLNKNRPRPMYRA